METHELKILSPYFDRIIDGTKTFEIRRETNGRRFVTGDRLVLRESNGIRYTGRSITKTVLYVYRFDDDDFGALLADDVVVMALGATFSSPW